MLTSPFFWDALGLPCRPLTVIPLRDFSAKNATNNFQAPGKIWVQHGLFDMWVHRPAGIQVFSGIGVRSDILGDIFKLENPDCLVFLSGILKKSHGDFCIGWDSCPWLPAQQADGCWNILFGEGVLEGAAPVLLQLERNNSLDMLVALSCRRPGSAAIFNCSP